MGHETLCGRRCLRRIAGAIKDELALTVADKPGEQAYHVWGRHYELTISAGRRVRTIVNMLRIYKILGQETSSVQVLLPARRRGRALGPSAARGRGQRTGAYRRARVQLAAARHAGARRGLSA